MSPPIAVDIAELRQAEFARQDVSRRGCLDAAQFRIAMGQVAWRMRPERMLTGPWFDALFRELDADQDGLVTFAEYQFGVDQLHAFEYGKSSDEWRRYAERRKQENDASSVSTAMSSASARMQPQGSSSSSRIEEAYTTMSGGELGSGAFGSVVKVRHRFTGAERACKVVPVETWQAAELVRLEVSMLKSLDHVSLLRLYEVFYEGSTVCMVTELCQGGSLADRLTYHRQIAHPMAEGHAARYLEQMLSAAAYCHERGVVHRDLKPDNVLFVSGAGESPLKIIDFGLAETLDRLQSNRREEMVQREGAIGAMARLLPKLPDGRELIATQVSRSAMQRAGTPHYMAPEVYKGEYGPKADMFSVGVMAVEMLSLIHPFYAEGDDLEAVRHKIVERGPDLSGLDAANLSTRANWWCKWLLRRDPVSRAGSREALADEWFGSFSHLAPTKGGALAVSAAVVCEALLRYASSGQLRQLALRALARELTEPQVAALRQAFLHLDRDGDGVLGVSELVAAAGGGGSSGAAEVQAAVKAVGLNSTRGGGGGGGIGYTDFLALMLPHHVKLLPEQLANAFEHLDGLNDGCLSGAGLRQAVLGSSRGYSSISPALLDGAGAELEEIRTLDLPGFCRLVQVAVAQV